MCEPVNMTDEKITKNQQQYNNISVVLLNFSSHICQRHLPTTYFIVDVLEHKYKFCDFSLDCNKNERMFQNTISD